MPGMRVIDSEKQKRQSWIPGLELVVGTRLQVGTKYERLKMARSLCYAKGLKGTPTTMMTWDGNDIDDDFYTCPTLLLCDK